MELCYITGNQLHEVTTHLLCYMNGIISVILHEINYVTLH